MEQSLTAVSEEFKGFCASTAGRIHAAAMEELAMHRAELDRRAEALDERERALDQRERSLERREGASRQAGSASKPPEPLPMSVEKAATPLPSLPAAGNANKLKAMFEQKAAARNGEGNMPSARRTAPAAAAPEAKPQLSIMPFMSRREETPAELTQHDYDNFMRAVKADANCDIFEFGRNMDWVARLHHSA